MRVLSRRASDLDQPPRFGVPWTATPARAFQLGYQPGVDTASVGGSIMWNAALVHQASMVAIEAPDRGAPTPLRPAFPRLDSLPGGSGSGAAPMVIQRSQDEPDTPSEDAPPTSEVLAQEEPVQSALGTAASDQLPTDSALSVSSATATSAPDTQGADQPTSAALDHNHDEDTQPAAQAASDAPAGLTNELGSPSQQASAGGETSADSQQDAGAAAPATGESDHTLHLPFGIDIPLPDIPLPSLPIPSLDPGDLSDLASVIERALGGDTPDPLTTGNCAPSATTINVSGGTKTVHGKSLADIAPNFDGNEGGSVTRGSISTDYCPDPKDAPPTSAVVSIPVTKTLPNWPEAGQTCKPAQDEWNRFSAAVDRHESRHVSIVQNVYKGVHTKLVGQKDPDAALDKVIAEEDKQQDAFHKEASAYSGMNLDAGVFCGAPGVKSLP